MKANHKIISAAPPEGPAPKASRRRGPSPTKTAQTRRAIVDAALDIFLDRGFPETRMLDVARRANLAKGTLYLYFDDKAALFEGVVREVIAAPIAEALASAPDEDETIRGFLTRAILPYMRDMERSRRADMLRLIISEGSRFPELADAYRRSALQPIIDLIQRLIRRAIARGEIASRSIERFPLLLLAPGLMASVWNGLYGKQQPMDAGAVFEAYLDLIFGPAAAPLKDGVGAA